MNSQQDTEWEWWLNSFYCRSSRLRSWPSFGLHLGCTEDHESPEAPVSLFGYSDDNYFITMNTISQLCREEAEVDSVQESEIEWLSSTIIFLKGDYLGLQHLWNPEKILSSTLEVVFGHLIDILNFIKGLTVVSILAIKAVEKDPSRNRAQHFSMRFIDGGGLGSYCRYSVIKYTFRNEAVPEPTGMPSVRVESGKKGNSIKRRP